jgi:glutamate formiminotransferase
LAELLECVPNYSEGRDHETIKRLSACFDLPGCTLLDTQSDHDHNRSVFTLVGQREALLKGLTASVRVAVERINLRSHTGAHPRVGAVDVVPFVPLSGTSMEKAVAASREFAETVAREFRIPVYFYEESALRHERTNLENVRRKGFEDLASVIETDPDRAPDVGEPRIHPTAGAMITGARRPLIAYNIYLRTTDVSIAKSIAKSIRHSSGGLRYVKALGLDIPERGCVQVSMNLTNVTATTIPTVFEMVKSAADGYGVAISDSEVVGMIPMAALVEVSRRYLRMHTFRDVQILELRLLQDAEPQEVTS